jgi:hypothetical protein
MHSNEPELTTEQSNDVEWLAFCYVANEMPVDQRDRFEERLANDQAAREAVATVVELTQTIAGIESVEHSIQVATPPSRGAQVWQRATWIATAVAACLAIVLGYQLVSHVLNNGDDQPDGIAEEDLDSGRDSSELAQAWVEAADDSSEILLVGVSTDNSNGEALEDSAFSDSMVEPETVETPDWMLAAVSGMSGEAPEVREH